MEIFGYEIRRKPERRDGSWDRLVAEIGPGVSHVSSRLAENLSVVIACTDMIAGNISALPFEVQRRNAAGSFDVTTEHPLARVIRDGVTPHLSWPDFAEWLIASALLAGNGLAEIVRDRAGALVGLIPIPWSAVSVSRVTNSDRVVFDVTSHASIFGESGRPRRLLDSEAFWLRDRTDDGLIGRSRLSRAAGVISPAIDLQTVTGSLWRNGLNPSGSVEMEGRLSDEARAALRRSMEQFHRGPKDAAKVLVLDGGMKYKGIAVSPEDAELLESRRFTVEEIARVFGCPGPVIGHLEDSNFANSWSMQRWFASTTLQRWITKFTSEVHRSVFSSEAKRTHRLVIDLFGLANGDPAVRWNAHKIAVEAGILDANEIRVLEGWPERAAAPAVE